MDLRGHLTSIWLRKHFIAGLALLVALVVLALRLFTPPIYAASSTVRVDIRGESDDRRSESVPFHTQTVIGLTAMPEVLQDAVIRSGLPIRLDEAANRVNVTATKTPGFLTVTALGPSPPEATALGNAITAALGAQLAKDEAATVNGATSPLRKQIAEVETEMARLAPTAPERVVLEQHYSTLTEAITEIEARPTPELLVGSPAAGSDEPVSPAPVRDAILAFVVALIIIAEGVVVVRAARGRLSEGDLVGQVEQGLNLPAVELDRTRDPVAVLAPLYRARLSNAPVLTVVQLAPPWADDVGHWLAQSAALVGDDARHADLTTKVGCEIGLQEPVRIRSLRRASVDSDVLSLIRENPGPVVVAVDTASTSLRNLVRDVDALRAVGARVEAVAVWRGRFPRSKQCHDARPSLLDAGYAKSSSRSDVPRPRGASGSATGGS